MSTLQQARESLQEIALEASEEGWDGYGALPVDAASLAHAHGFLNALPLGFPIPEFCVYPDGDVGMDWLGMAGEIVSVCFSPNGTISYSGRLDDGFFHGSFLGPDGAPGVLTDIIIARIFR